MLDQNWSGGSYIDADFFGGADSITIQNECDCLFLVAGVKLLVKTHQEDSKVLPPNNVLAIVRIPDCMVASGSKVLYLRMSEVFFFAGSIC
jgi:hypothetical protein